jgi:hypothetical protein
MDLVSGEWFEECKVTELTFAQLSRLIAGSGASPTKQKPNTPAERLAVCKRACSALQVPIRRLVLWNTSKLTTNSTSGVMGAQYQRTKL